MNTSMTGILAVWLLISTRLQMCNANLKDVVKPEKFDSSLMVSACRWLQVDARALRMVLAEEETPVQHTAEALLEALHQDSFTAFVVWEKNKGKKFVVLNGHYVILFQNDENLDTLGGLFKSGGTYTLLWVLGSTSGEEENEIEMDRVLRWLWDQYSVLQVTLVRMDLTGNWSAATFDPFSTVNTMSSLDFTEERGRLKPIKDVRRLAKVNARFTRYLRNFRGYEVAVSFFSYGSTALIVPGSNNTDIQGRDANVVKALSRAAGFSLRVLDSKGFGEAFLNGTFSQALDDVATGHAHFAANGRAMVSFGEDVPIAFMEHVGSAFDVLVLVPRAGELPPWFIFFRCFSWEVWSLLAATTLVSGWAWSLLRTPPAGLGSSLAGVAHAITSMAWSRLREVRGVRERAVFAVLLLSCVVCVVCFQSVLVNFFTSPPRYPEIDSIPELERSGLHVRVGSPYFLDIFRYRSSSVWKRLDDRVSVTKAPDFSDDLEDVVRGQKFAFTASDRTLRKWIRLTPNKLRAVHVLPLSLRTVLESYILKRNSPYLHRFKKIFRHLIDSGLMRKWNLDMADYGTNKLTVQDSSYKTGPVQYSLEQLQPAFVFLLVGLLASVVWFMGEMAYIRLSRSKRNKKEELANIRSSNSV